MQEDFLHYIWKYKKLDLANLMTTNSEVVEIMHVGQHNQNAGPDFFNAQIRIDSQLWAGNVEIHVKSSDWFVHNHEKDSAYDNVILHVVWEHDTEVFRKDNTPIPCLELQRFVSESVLNQYQKLFASKHKWINCENDLPTVDDFSIQNWLERLFFERLEQKSRIIEDQLKKSTNNWEAVLFKMLFKNFGLKVNGEAFLSIANSIDFSIVRKLQNNITALEALFFGQAGFLEEDVQEPYFIQLKKEYQYLKHKFDLRIDGVFPVQFFRLRPPNFPTIRLSQLAKLYHLHQNLFSKVMEAKTINSFYAFFYVNATEFWQTHYTFSKESPKSKKHLTKSFIDLLLINTVIPIKFSYLKYQGKMDEDEILNLIQSISSEQNSIIDKFNSIKPISTSAMHSQALLHLKNNYCDKNYCLQCAIGNTILTRNS